MMMRMMMKSHFLKRCSLSERLKTVRSLIVTISVNLRKTMQLKKSNFRTCMTICEEEKTFLKRVEESQDFFPVLLQWHGEKRPNQPLTNEAERYRNFKCMSVPHLMPIDNQVCYFCPNDQSMHFSNCLAITDFYKVKLQEYVSKIHTFQERYKLKKKDVHTQVK